MKTVLILGDGGREATLALKMAESPQVHKVLIYPYFPAACLYHPEKIFSFPNMNLDQILREHQIHMAVIGPESYLQEGLTENLESQGIFTVAPSRQAAEIELSKIYAKNVMIRAGVKTAEFRVCSNLTELRQRLDEVDWPGYVLKADRPFAGKGVVVCEHRERAFEIGQKLFEGSYLGSPSGPLVLEQKIVGPEISMFALCDGDSFLYLGSCRDYKRLLDHQRGPNTGGMGAISPVPDLTADEIQWAQKEIFQKVISQMKKEGRPYRGFLFAGVMRTPEGLQVLEFNARLGDPETQVLLLKLKNDLFELLWSLKTTSLSGQTVHWHSDYFLHVVLACAGYPGVQGEVIQTGDVVEWTPFPDSTSVLVPSGLQLSEEGLWKTQRGRALGVTVRAGTLESAREKALELAQKFKFSGAHYRRDIGSS